MTPESLLKAYGEKNGLENCAFSADGLCRFVLANTLYADLELQADKKRILMQCSAGTMANPCYYADILSINLHYSAETPYVVALDSFSNEVLMLTLLGPDMELDAFSEAVENFSEEVNGLKNLLITMNMGGMDIPEEDTPVASAQPMQFV